MSKIITSPVKRFTGTVSISDPLTLPQVIGIESAIREAGKLGERENATQAEYDLALLPSLLACVEKVEIAGWQDGRFPATPRASSAQLLAWLAGEIVALFREAEDLPNG